MQLRHDIRALSQNFRVLADYQGAEPYGGGHINDTYAATYRQGGATIRYIHQRINHNVFKNPVALMENVERVTNHLHAKLGGQSDVTRRTLTLVPAGDGRMFYIDPQGNCWRTYVFIEGARTYDAVESTKQAYRGGQGVRAVPAACCPTCPPRVCTTRSPTSTIRRCVLPPWRRRSTPTRPIARRLARAEIDFALRRKAMTARLIDLQSQGVLPERTTHNDTKFNNVMLDDATQEGICVIDLDTVMPGLALYDFGDMVRTTTSPALEDEKDLSKVCMQFPMFEALVRGYLASAGDMLNKAEKEHLAFAGKLITFEIGIRFLADFLAGDVYFKVHREGHNLDRCRTQFKLVASIEAQEEAMKRLVERC